MVVKMLGTSTKTYIHKKQCIYITSLSYFLNTRRYNQWNVGSFASTNTDSKKG